MAARSTEQVGGVRYPRDVLALRIVIVVLLLVAAAIAVVPALVLFDLVSGGTGWGLCPTGLAVCDPGYFAGPELFAILSVSLFVVLGLVVGCLRLLRHLTGRTGRDLLA